MAPGLPGGGFVGESEGVGVSRFRGLRLSGSGF